MISVYQDLVGKQRKLLKRRTRLLEEVPEIMVMEDRSEVRPTFLLDRGQYNMPIEQVSLGTPKAVMPFPSSFPRNRLGLGPMVGRCKQSPDGAGCGQSILANDFWTRLG